MFSKRCESTEVDRKQAETKRDYNFNIFNTHNLYAFKTLRINRMQPYNFHYMCPPGLTGLPAVKLTK